MIQSSRLYVLQHCLLSRPYLSLLFCNLIIMYMTMNYFYLSCQIYIYTVFPGPVVPYFSSVLKNSQSLPFKIFSLFHLSVFFRDSSLTYARSGAGKLFLKRASQVTLQSLLHILYCFVLFLFQQYKPILSSQQDMCLAEKYATLSLFHGS